MVKPKLEQKKEAGRAVPAFRIKLGNRLRVLEKRFPNREAAAKAAKAAKSTFQSWVEGKADPSFEGLWNFARETGVSLDWLAGTTEEMSDVAEFGRNPPKTMVAIPIFEVSPSAGHGNAAANEKPVDYLWFNEAWLRQSYGVNPSDLKLLPSKGDSMVPTIAAGAMLMVDTGEDARQPGDGVYVVRLEGNILVKRLQRFPGNRIKVSSDNPAFDPYNVQIDDPGIDFVLLGRVIVAIDLKRL